MRSSTVKAEDFADTSSPTSLFLFPVTYDLKQTPPSNKRRPWVNAASETLKN